ncbi:MAG: phospho-N-acetylmuramoyl-pentapeptide-transferase, partial [Paramuribaculum sp.]|nr:phospho-N-acetylmuramoyl-pentapeptide-transferase [Paramuribaculum sp.]
MLYYLSEYLQEWGVPGSRLMTYVTFRSACALVLSLFMATFFGSRFINMLRRHQIGEIVRNLGFEGENSKRGTPTMGGIIIIISIVVPCLLVSRLDNIYMILILLTTVWLGAVGFADDWLKIKYKNKDGLKGWYKIFWQALLGVVVGLTMWLNPDITIRQNNEIENIPGRETVVVYQPTEVKSPETTIPFVKNHNFDYSSLTSWAGQYAETAGWLLFILVCIS